MSRAALLRASLLAIVAPTLACGGNVAATEHTASPGAGGSGGTTAGVGGAAGSVGGGASTTPYPCKNPVPIVIGGVDTGFATCAAGQIERPAIVACPLVPPRPDVCTGMAPSQATCAHDADCTAAPNGHCAAWINNFACSCGYGCATDQECGPGAICLCGSLAGRCVPATCVSNADCPEGPCSSYDTKPDVCPTPSFGCQRSGDACGGDQECDGKGSGLMRCTVASATSTRVCRHETAICQTGRPLFVEHRVRVANITHRSDWARAQLGQVATRLKSLRPKPGSASASSSRAVLRRCVRRYGNAPPPVRFRSRSSVLCVWQ